MNKDVYKRTRKALDDLESAMGYFKWVSGNFRRDEAKDAALYTYRTLSMVHGNLNSVLVAAENAENDAG